MRLKFAPLRRTLSAPPPVVEALAMPPTAMKAKQTVDVAQCDTLEHAVEDFSKMYLPAEA